MKTITRIALFLAIALVGASCAKRTVTRVDPSQEIDLSGRWNDVDSKKVAEEVTREILNSPRYSQYASDKGHRPAIIVGYIKNKTSEHIDADNFIKKFEMEIFNSGIADLVESGEFRESLRAERADQQEFASPETTARWGRETGADAMLFGTMTSETDTYDKKKVVNYIVTLYLTDMETNKRIWYGQKEIKKFVKG